MDGGKALANIAPKSGEQQKRSYEYGPPPCAKNNLKDRDDGETPTIQEAIATARNKRKESSKRKQTVFKSSLRKRTKEKTRRIQCNEAMDQLLELIIQVQEKSKETSSSEDHADILNVSMISNRGELIERAVLVMKRLIKENATQQTRIEGLERAILASQRASTVLDTTAPPGVTLSPSGISEQTLQQLLNQLGGIPPQVTGKQGFPDASTPRVITGVGNHTFPQLLNQVGVTPRPTGMDAHNFPRLLNQAGINPRPSGTSEHYFPHLLNQACVIPRPIGTGKDNFPQLLNQTGVTPRPTGTGEHNFPQLLNQTGVTPRPTGTGEHNFPQLLNQVDVTPRPTGTGEHNFPQLLNQTGENFPQLLNQVDVTPRPSSTGRHNFPVLLNNQASVPSNNVLACQGAEASETLDSNLTSHSDSEAQHSLVTPLERGRAHPLGAPPFVVLPQPDYLFPSADVASSLFLEQDQRFRTTQDLYQGKHHGATITVKAWGSTVPPDDSPRCITVKARSATAGVGDIS